MDNTRARAWCWTFPNYTEDDVKRITALEQHRRPLIRYLIAGRETSPQTGLVHLQGYTYFENAVVFRTAQKLIGGDVKIHIVPAKGTPKENTLYCEKDKDVIRFGDEPQQGAGHAHDEIRMAVKNGTPLPAIIDICENFNEIRFAEKLTEYARMPEREPPIVNWYWGPTDTGKTRTAIAEAKEIAPENWWLSAKNLKWWQGYHGQKAVIIDDFRADFCTFHELLRILDRYPYCVEYKGGSCWLAATHIWVTCPKSPRDVWDGRSAEDIAQLERRITNIKSFAPEHNEAPDGFFG